MKYLKMFSVFAVGCGVMLASALPSQAALTKSKTLQGDINGDGKKETVAISPCGNYYAKVKVFNRSGKLMWSGSDVPNVDCNTCFLGDVNGDKRAELVLGTPHGAEVLYWKNGKFTEPTYFLLARSKQDTTQFYCIVEDANREKDQAWEDKYLEDYREWEYKEDGTSELAKYGSLVMLGNLRQVAGHWWGDVSVCGNIKARVRLAKLNLAQKQLIKAVEGKDDYANLPRNSSFACIPTPVKTKLTADLNGDGNDETVTFNSYYPCSNNCERYQIVVRDNKGGLLWESPRVTCDYLNSTNKPSPYQAGVIIRPSTGKNAISSGLLADIDGDGKIELVASTWERGMEWMEVWRWRNGKFEYVKNTHLVRSATDPSMFLFTDDIYGDKRLKRNVHKYSEGDTVEEYTAVSNLRRRNGAIWGITGVCGYGTNNTEVQLVPCKGGMKVVNSKPHDSCYWDLDYGF